MANAMGIDEMRVDGKLPIHAWPGGYPMYYITQDMGILCPKCANDNAYLSGDVDDPQWNVIHAEINFEDETLTCDHCYEPIEAAYPTD